MTVTAFDYDPAPVKVLVWDLTQVEELAQRAQGNGGERASRAAVHCIRVDCGGPVILNAHLIM